jgi:hypothetical protein
MKLPNDRLLLHLARDRRRAVDPLDIYFLEATGETTLVRRRSSRRLREARGLGERAGWPRVELSGDAQQVGTSFLRGRRLSAAWPDVDSYPHSNSDRMTS